jgi:hypothetical protein
MIIKKWSDLLQLVVAEEDKRSIQAWFTVLDTEGPVHSNCNSASNLNASLHELAVLVALSFNLLAWSTVQLVWKDNTVELFAKNATAEAVAELRIEYSRKIVLKQLAGATLCLSEGHDRLLARNGDERCQLFADVMRLKELNCLPVDIAADDFITNHASLASYSRELSGLVSPTFLPALILLPDAARYAAYSLFIAVHSTNF